MGGRRGRALGRRHWSAPRSRWSTRSDASCGLAGAEEERELPFGIMDQLARGLAAGSGQPEVLSSGARSVPIPSRWVQTSWWRSQSRPCRWFSSSRTSNGSTRSRDARCSSPCVPWHPTRSVVPARFVLVGMQLVQCGRSLRNALRTTAARTSLSRPTSSFEWSASSMPAAVTSSSPTPDVTEFLTSPS